MALVLSAPYPAAVAGGDFVNDQFTTATDTPIAQHTPDIGGVWTPFGAGVNVIAASNTAMPQTTAEDNGALNGASPPSADYTSAVTLTTKIAGKNTPQVYVRATLNGTSIADCYFAFYAGSDTIYFSKKKGGSYTELRTIKVTMVVGDTLSITAAGTTISVAVNNTTVASLTDTSVTAPGRAGFAGNGGNVDNFRAYA